MDNAKAHAVLQAAEGFFQEEELHGHPAVIGDGPQAIGEKLGLPPAEVLVLLRMLHRRGMIALLGSIGPHVMIAREQSLLRPPTAVITGGGKNAKLGRGRRIRSPEESFEEGTEATDLSDLQEYIAQLERILDEVQARAEEADKRRKNISDARRRSDEAKAGTEEELRRAKAENRTLTQQIEALQAEADKVPELERRIGELERSRALPDDLAATIARLTQ